MVDWKDVNKELPKKDCICLYCILDFAGDGDNYFFKIGRFTKKGIDKFSGFSAFENWGKTIYRTTMTRLTHWAYINEPEDKNGK